MLKNFELAITRKVTASVIADVADSSDHKEKSNTGSDGGTSGCGSKSLAPPTCYKK